MASSQIFGNLMHPAVRLRRTIAVAQACEHPGVLHGMPEVEDLAAVDEPRRAVPDPFGPVSHNHYRRIGPQPVQFLQLRIQPVEYRIGISQTAHQKPLHQRSASG